MKAGSSPKYFLPGNHPTSMSEVQKEYFIEYEEFKRLKDQEDVILFDARPYEVYKEGGLWIKNGHIPGANSLPWRTLMTKDNARLMKSDEELQELVASSTSPLRRT